MKIKIEKIIFIIFFLFLSNCNQYPLGMSKKEFLSLPIEKQYEARPKQAEIDAANKLKMLEIERIRAEEKKQFIETEQKKIEQLYNNAAKIRVNISDGKIKSYKEFQTFTIAPVILALGEVKKIKVYINEEYGSNIKHLWISYQPGGLYFDITPIFEKRELDSYVCLNPDELIEPTHINKPYIIPEIRAWKFGKKYTITHSANLNFQNINIYIEYVK